MAYDTSFNVSGGDWLGAITNIPFQALSYSNAKENQSYQREQDKLNRQMQYDFAQNSIKWRVNDAKQSGIHPLAALGVSPSSAQPIYSASESVRSPNFNFGELFSAQINLLESEAEKNKAEANAISGQSGGLSFIDDSSKPGPSPKTSTEIGSTFIKNEQDRINLLKEKAQDDSITTAFYDTKSKLERGEVNVHKEIDMIASAVSGFAHFAQKGETWAKNGLKNIQESIGRGLSDLKSFVFGDIGTKSNSKANYQKHSFPPEIKKQLDEIDKQLKSFSNWR